MLILPEERINFKLSNIFGNNVYIKIDKMNDDILAQIVSDLISDTAKFSLQFDETTNVSNLSQLAVFMRYGKEDVKKRVFLFCQPLITATKVAEVKKFVDNFFRDNNLLWDIVYAIFLNGARVMLERNSGFVTKVCNAFVFCTGMHWQQKPSLQNWQ